MSGDLLKSIHLPADLRRMDRHALPAVVNELREYLLNVVAEKGGHLASNLGSVELTVALHYIFNTPHDKIIWDVGHQAYNHKILTGRREAFPTIRQYQGLSGFTCREESEYDAFGAGHASTSISAALGIAEGMRHKGLPNLSIAVVGDGSLTGGLVFEALNNAGHVPAKNLVVIFNDNDMSIDPNVGALNRYINHCMTHPNYHFKAGMLFECFGFKYFGPVDGHDVDALVDVFTKIRESGAEGGPYLVHALTTKGKGYQRAEDMPVKYHGVNPFKIEEGLLSGGPKKVNYQDVFADALTKVGKNNEKVVAITAAMPSGTGLVKFQKEIPNRFYDVGIAEAHAVLFAAGLATEDYRPVVAIYSTFLQRAYDQVIHDVGLQNLPVIFAMDRAGLVGADGATHQGAFDLTYLRTVPNFVVMAPKDENELQHMVYTAIQYQKGPIAFRYPRGEVVGVPMDEKMHTLPIGEGELLSSDSETPDILIIGVGYGVQIGLQVQEALRETGLQTAAINARFIKPLDKNLLLPWISSSRLVVCIEENAVQGGFGAAVMELMSEHQISKQTMLFGLPDQFVEHATQSQQRTLAGLDAPSISSKILERWKGLVSPSRGLPVYEAPLLQ